MALAEIPLSGGNVNAGVWRVGDTVRRAVSPTSHAVHELLRHLEAKGFPGSPRFLGIDDQGREILSYLEGETGLLPFLWTSDVTLVTAAQLLRAYHDATVDFPFQAQQWPQAYPDQTRHEVVCHNDFGAYNLVYQGERAVGLIDFDLAGPGPRLRDVAYGAYWFTPLSFNSADQVSYAEADIRAGSRRLKLYCASYGLAVTPALFAMVEEVLTQMGDEEHVTKLVGPTAAAKLIAEGHLRGWQGEAAVFRDNRDRFAQNFDWAPR